MKKRLGIFLVPLVLAAMFVGLSGSPAQAHNRTYTTNLVDVDWHWDYDFCGPEGPSLICGPQQPRLTIVESITGFVQSGKVACEDDRTVNVWYVDNITQDKVGDSSTTSYSGQFVLDPNNSLYPIALGSYTVKVTKETLKNTAAHRHVCGADTQTGVV